MISLRLGGYTPPLWPKAQLTANTGLHVVTFTSSKRSGVKIEAEEVDVEEAGDLDCSWFLFTGLTR